MQSESSLPLSLSLKTDKTRKNWEVEIVQKKAKLNQQRPFQLKQRAIYQLDRSGYNLKEKTSLIQFINVAPHKRK